MAARRYSREEIFGGLRLAMEQCGPGLTVSKWDALSMGPCYRSLTERFKMPWEELKATALVGFPMPGETTPAFLDKKTESLPWREALAVVRDMQGIHEQASYTQSKATIALPAATPAAVAFLADLHVGALGVDYGHMEAAIQFILDTPNLYVALVGDLIENSLHFRNITPTVTQIIPPKIQAQVLDDIVQELAKARKLLFAGWGNHDQEREEKALGYSPTARLIAAHVPFFNGKGICNLKIGEQEYQVFATHQASYSSYLNSLHGAMQERRQHFPNADVAVTAHRHQPAVGIFPWQDVAQGMGGEEPRYYVAVATGTFKTDCGYSKRYFAGGGTLGWPVVVFRHDRHAMTPFMTAGEAVGYMAGLRAAA